MFHSLDKVTSLFLHLFPAFVAWTERWHPDVVRSAACHTFLDPFGPVACMPGRTHSLRLQQGPVMHACMHVCPAGRADRATSLVLGHPG